MKTEFLINKLHKNLHFEISYGCNIKCPMCTFHNDKHKNEFVKSEKIKFSEENFKYFSQIHIGDGSEPFINPDWFEIVQSFKNLNKKVSLQTNGKTISNLAFAKKVVFSGVDFLSISIDGVNNETVSKIRKGITFNEIITAIDLINQAKKELNSMTPYLSSNIVAMSSNLDQLKALVDLLYSKNIRKVRIGFLELREENKDLVHQLTIYEKDKIKQVLQEIKDELRFKSKEFILNTSVFDSIERKDCQAYFERLYLRQDGNLYACYGKKFLGNVYTDGMRNCLESNEYFDFVDTVSKKNNEVCASCRFCEVLLFDDIRSHFSQKAISFYTEEKILESLSIEQSKQNITSFWSKFYNQMKK